MVDLTQDPDALDLYQMAMASQKANDRYFGQQHGEPAPPLVSEGPSLMEMARQQEEQRQAQAMAAINEKYGAQFGMNRGAVEASPPAAVPEGASPVEQMVGMQQARAGDTADLGQALMQRRTYLAPNPMYGPTKKYVGAAGQAMGREQEAEYQAADARATQEQALADEYEYQVREESTRLAVQQAKDRLHVEQQEQALEAKRQVQLKISEAVDRFSQAPDVDPNRFWASQSAGQKVGWAISAGLLGMSGMNPFAHIESAIAKEIDAQKTNLAKRENVIAGRQSEFNAADSVYASLREGIQDERALDLAHENAILERSKRQIQALVAKTGVQVLRPEQQAFLAQFDQKIAANTLRLDQMAAANPRAFVRTKYALTGPARQVVTKAYEQGLKQQGEREGDVTKALQEQAKAQAESKGAGLGLKPEAFTSSLREYAKMRGEHEVLQKRLRGFLTKYGEDIPGVTESVFLPNAQGLTDEARKARSELGQMFDTYRVMVTGAGASEGEIAKLEQNLFGAKTEGEIRKAILDMESKAKNWLENAERGTPDEVRAYYNRNANTPDLAPISGTVSGGASYKRERVD